MNKRIISLHNFLLHPQKICPCFGFLRRIAQQVCRMETGQNRHGFAVALSILQPFAAQPRNRLLVVQQGICGTAAQNDDNFGINQLDLPFQKRQTDGNFAVRRRPVSRRTPGQNVGNIARRPVNVDRFQHLVQKLSAAADKRQSDSCLLYTSPSPRDA